MWNRWNALNGAMIEEISNVLLYVAILCDLILDFYAFAFADSFFYSNFNL